MITERDLEILRCPFPTQRDVPLVLDNEALVCSSCRVQFSTQDGIANLIPDDATLPDGCARKADLPCQQRVGQGS